jgi:hypothetical protein
MMPRKRSRSVWSDKEKASGAISDEASGAIKTLKRLECTNPSVRIDRMDDYLAIYRKTSDASSQYPLSMSKA